MILQLNKNFEIFEACHVELYRLLISNADSWRFTSLELFSVCLQIFCWVATSELKKKETQDTLKKSNYVLDY